MLPLRGRSAAGQRKQERKSVTPSGAKVTHHSYVTFWQYAALSAVPKLLTLLVIQYATSKFRVSALWNELVLVSVVGI
jgi:hypothetical protein